MVKRASQQYITDHLGMWLKRLLLMLLLITQLFSSKAFTQESDSSRTSPKRLKWLVRGSAVGYAGLLTGLNVLWYKDHPRSEFHFFNDNKQWMLADKSGHSYSAYQLSRAGSEALQWAGLDRKRSALFGGLGGFIFMLPVEILDGYSAEYGASWGDLAANGAGSLLYTGQILIWDKVLIKPKFSFHPTAFAAQRPNVLGDHFSQQLLKDYNGQTYWLSASMHDILPAGNKFPRWLNIAAGYGTEGMVFAHRSVSKMAGYHPYPQFYLGPDIDLSFIKTQKRVVKILLFLLEGIKLPAPALEFGNNRIRFHPVYF